MQENLSLFTNMVIYDYYPSLTDEKKKEFRDKVLLRIGISLPTFYYRMRKRLWRPGDIEIMHYIIKDIEDAGKN